MDDRASPHEDYPRAPLPDWWWNLTWQSRRLIAVAVLVAVLIVLFVIVAAIATGGDDQTDEPATTEPDSALFVASLPPARVAQWDQLAQCESESRWDLDTGNGFHGGLQFTLQSWGEVGGTGSPAAATREEQIMRAESLYELQGWGAWPNCSAQLGFS